MSAPARPLFHVASFRVLRWLLAAVMVVIVCLLRWGGDLLTASDPAPEHVDAAIVLQGSIAAEKARMAGAMDFLRRGVASRALISVPKESYWGQSIPLVARSYLERTYGSDLAARVDFCEIGADADSTVQEAQALNPCIQEHRWQSIVIVTSNYHTRRARILWRRAVRREPNIHIWIEGVPDPDFQQPWWRHRQSAKIWVMETTKLVWTLLGGR
jgi:uncharacterized SAM-binding protein YcdF (DUF218 family)